jgi:hypothetical protein
MVKSLILTVYPNCPLMWPFGNACVYSQTFLRECPVTNTYHTQQGRKSWVWFSDDIIWGAFQIPESGHLSQGKEMRTRQSSARGDREVLGWIPLLWTERIRSRDVWTVLTLSHSMARPWTELLGSLLQYLQFVVASLPPLSLTVTWRRESPCISNTYWTLTGIFHL